MHVLRCTLFATSPTDHMHTVVRESDVTSFGELLAGNPPGTFLVHEVFEMDEGSIERATGEAMARATKRASTDINMAISFFWNADQLARLHPGGTLANPAPAPYGSEECRQVLLQLARHPAYDAQTMIQNANDGTTVVYKNGEVTVHEH